jgi:hypothetical protein
MNSRPIRRATALLAEAYSTRPGRMPYLRRLLRLFGMGNACR